MRAQLLHLSGPRRGRTVTYEDSAVTVGAAADCDLRLDDPAVAARHAVLEFHADDCAFHLRAQGGAVFVNRHEVREVILEDGDLIEWGLGGPRSRFRLYVEPGRTCKPVRRMLADAADVSSHSSSAVAGASGLVRDLLTQATPQLKVGVPVAILLIALPLAWLAGWLGSQPSRAERQRADEVAAAELQRLRQQQEDQRRQLEQLRRSSQVFAEVQQRWSRGICLIHGIVGVRWPDGRELIGADGRPLRAEYTGSGFLADAGGGVLTNRHVVQPWENMPGVQAAMRGGAEPRFVRLTATFPGTRPIAVPVDTIRARDDELDVATFRLPVAALDGVPVLPLYAGELGALPDRRAIVVGYPTGLAALLALADASLVDELRAARADMTTLIDRLAAADRVRPSFTQGVLGNIEERVVVYDAPTTHGGSGGPVFGGNGQVIAVNFAVLRDFAGANYGVPIRFGRELLE